MHGTIITYLKEYGNVSFHKMPMNDVDSLILCQFAYLKFDEMVPNVYENEPSITLRELSKHADYEKLFADERYAKSNKALFRGMLSGRRFRSLKLNYYINVVEKQWETQFSAITLMLEDGTLYIAFRGTDETIIGWKEDFNMTYLSPVPGQEYSAKYLNMVTSRFNNSFYVGGHSKGGNLAIYCSMNVLPDVQKRIKKIYSMDGPGFRQEVLTRCGYERIAPRVVKIMPHSALVGMLLQHDLNYKVVECKGIGLGLVQHNPFTWMVRDTEFVPADDIYESRKRMDNALSGWILSLSEEKLKVFVDALYQIVSASEAEDLIALFADPQKSVKGIMSAYKGMDEETATVFKAFAKSLFDIIRTRGRSVLPAPKKRFRLFGRRKKTAPKEQLPKL